MNKEKVLKSLSAIIDPDLNRDIVSLGFVKNIKIKEKSISLNLELTTPACPIKEEFKNSTKKILTQLGFKDIKISFSAQNNSMTRKENNGLKQVSNIIFVSSCKGGVGKSTIAANLVVGLQKTGAKVGIFDADLYGPSQHLFFEIKDKNIYQQNKLIVPFTLKGIKFMSPSFLNKNEDAFILRGPMASKLIVELLISTNWDTLDYLIIDMPPGTSDIHLSIAQYVQAQGNIIVTTPQQLSFTDVIKGIKMFNQLQVPTLAIVENMSHIEIDGKKQHIFGKSSTKKLKDLFQINEKFAIPFIPDLGQKFGEPYTLSHPKSTITKKFNQLSSYLIREIEKNKFFNKRKRELIIDHKTNSLIIREGGSEKSISFYDLRKKCRCALCIDEFTQKESNLLLGVKKDVKIIKEQRLGNYAFKILWDDNHESIYPFSHI